MSIRNNLSINWSCNQTWLQASKNTSLCLLGCCIGDFGTIAFFQFTEIAWPVMAIMSLAIVNFGPVIDDSLFMNIVHSMPENSLFILEDIDGLFIDRSQGSSNKSMVSFSGILNTLDGVG